jgi:hypothetical protein
MQRTIGLLAAIVIGGLSGIACVAHVYPEAEYPAYPPPAAEVYVEGGYHHHGYRHEEQERRERHARHEEHERHEHH